MAGDWLWLTAPFIVLPVPVIHGIQSVILRSVDQSLRPSHLANLQLLLGLPLGFVRKRRDKKVFIIWKGERCSFILWHSRVINCNWQWLIMYFKISSIEYFGWSQHKGMINVQYDRYNSCFGLITTHHIGIFKYHSAPHTLYFYCVC